MERWWNGCRCDRCKQTWRTWRWYRRRYPSTRTPGDACTDPAGARFTALLALVPPEARALARRRAEARVAAELGDIERLMQSDIPTREQTKRRAWRHVG